VNGTPAQPLIGTGQVRHTRLRPVVNRFAYPTAFLLLPMRRLREQPCAALARNAFGLIAFHDADHGDGRADSLAWLEELLARSGVDDVDGEVWLQCYPRVLGHTFKPVSFWFCHRADGSIAAIVTEVNNTFGERHCYLLRHDAAGRPIAFGRELLAAKVFHVSPFCAVEGAYRFRFLRSEGRDGVPPRTLARIDHHDADGLLLQTSVAGTLAPLSVGALRRLFVRMPWLMLGVVARIHWQALVLWCKGVPFFRKPAPPGRFVTR
jgi:uncharacterized protein